MKNEIKESIIMLDEKDAHPRRPRSKYAGKMIQMDASSFQWIEGEVWHLHVAIDDADGKVVGAYFDHQETLKGYYEVLYQILINHGIPAMFYVLYLNIKEKTSLLMLRIHSLSFLMPVIIWELK